MRGVIFNEFIEFVDQVLGPKMTEKMLEQCDLQTDGVYTSVGNYDHGEIIKMVAFLSQETGEEACKLVQNFGTHLFACLAKSHRAILGDEKSLLNFLEGIEGHIHKEVLKLYPNAELPTFETQRCSENHLIMHYQSIRPFADLAYGMIMGAARHFDISLKITRKDEFCDGRYHSDFDIRYC